MIALTAVRADSTPAALLAPGALTTVLAYSLPAALLALSALTTVRTTVAHLALRAVLHPVLAWPLVGRGSPPLHALLRQQLWDLHFPLGIVDVRNVYPDHRSPNRRHHSRAPDEVPPANILSPPTFSFISQPSQNEFAIFVNRKLDRNATVTSDGPRVLTRLDPAQHQWPIRRRLLAEFWVNSRA